jgi:hypothetical protein
MFEYTPKNNEEDVLDLAMEPISPMSSLGDLPTPSLGDEDEDRSFAVVGLAFVCWGAWAVVSTTTSHD